jgi:hypothetical protein
MALTWSGQAVTPAELKDQVYSPSRKGSLQLSMVAATHRRGNIAYEINEPENLHSEIAAGHPFRRSAFGDGLSRFGGLKAKPGWAKKLLSFFILLSTFNISNASHLKPKHNNQ